MNITPIVNKGLSFDLKHYCELKTERNGPNFWFIEHSNLLRDKLAPFLPRMDFDSQSQTVTASIVENGRELLSTSEAATPSLNNVPAEELIKLRDKIKALLAETQLPDEVRRVVEAFTLPRPGKMSECYRIYGSGNNKRLAIVWGMSLKDATGKEDLDSILSLRHFLGYMEDSGVVPTATGWKWILLGIAAAGVALYALNSENTDTPVTNEPQTIDVSGNTPGVDAATENTSQIIDVSGNTPGGDTVTTEDTPQIIDVSGNTPSGDTVTTEDPPQTINVSGNTPGVDAATENTSQTINVSGNTPGVDAATETTDNQTTDTSVTKMETETSSTTDNQTTDTSETNTETETSSATDTQTTDTSETQTETESTNSSATNNNNSKSTGSDTLPTTGSAARPGLPTTRRTATRPLPSHVLVPQQPFISETAVEVCQAATIRVELVYNITATDNPEMAIVRLRVTSSSPDVKFATIRVNGVRADANGCVQLTLKKGTHRLNVYAESEDDFQYQSPVTITVKDKD